MWSPLNILISDNAVLCLVRFTVSIRRETFANFMELPSRLRILSFMSLFVEQDIFYPRSGRQRKKATSGLIKSEELFTLKQTRTNSHFMRRSPLAFLIIIFGWRPGPGESITARLLDIFTESYYHLAAARARNALLVRARAPGDLWIWS